MAETTKRLNIRLTPDDMDKLKYWADKHDMKCAEFLRFCLEEQIKRDNSDYDLPVAEVARLNQLIDVVTTLSSNVKSLESVTVSGFDSLLGLTRGDNYLLEQDEN